MTTFFAWFTHPENIIEYKNNLNIAIFSCIESCKQPYDTIMMMPVKRFYDLIEWKSQLEEEKRKLIEEHNK